MTRSSRPAGFGSPAVTATSTRLMDAVAASLAIAALSLRLMVTVTVPSGELGTAMPVPA